MGATAMRLRAVTERKMIGSNRRGSAGIGDLAALRNAVMRGPDRMARATLI
jgi:hypothetical protein